MADGIDIDTAAEALATESITALQTVVPAWEAAPADFMRNALEANAVQLARVMQVFTAAVDARVFRPLGERVGVPLLTASYATVTLQFTTASGGVTVPAGYEVALLTDAGQQVGFATIEDVTTDPTTHMGTVIARALVAGAIGSGITGAGTPLTSSTEVLAVETVDQSIGGRDPETAEAYEPRLQSGLSILSPLPLVAGNLERWLAVRDYGLGRVLVIDNLVPPSTTGVALATTIAVTDPDGEPAGSVTDTIKDDLDVVRGQDYDHYVIDATYTTIDVNAAVNAEPGADPVAVKAAAEAALTSFFSPALWGRPQSGDSALGTLTGWSNKDKVRLLEIGAVLENTEGVSQATAATFRKTGGSFATADVTLTGPAPLTRPGTMTVTVS